MADHDTPAPLKRLESLEALVRALHQELERVRADVAMLRGNPVRSMMAEASAPPPAPAPRSTASAAARPVASPTAASPRRERPSVEQLVGRYGTIGVATVAILLGIGAFLQWAITRGLLGPEVRVGLGALAALAFAAVGWRLRRRNSTRFGNILLALALAIVHLDAWAAGPNLHLVPSVVALLVAAVASGLLAALAVADRAELLFAVGVGGALLAPFVTSENSGNYQALLIFGWVTSTAAIFALREPAWWLARRLIASFAGIYVWAAAAGLAGSAAAKEFLMPAVFVAGLVVSSLLLAEATGRRALTRWLLTLMIVALLVSALSPAPEWNGVALAFIGTLAVHAMRRRAEITPGGGDDTLFDSVVLPIGFLIAGLASLTDATSPAGAAVSGIWGALAALLVLLSPEAQRARHLTGLFVALELALLMGAHDVPLVIAMSSAALACVVCIVLDRIRGLELLLPLGMALLAATYQGYQLLEERTAYHYTPFLTTASLAALAVVVAWSFFARVVPRVLQEGDEPYSKSAVPAEVNLLRAMGAIALLLWGRQEFARAYSADAATFLLICFYAAFGVVSIGFGRARALPAVRHAGLALSLFAAFKAVAQASSLASVGLRVGSYLVVGIFLLGVGYWYRAGAVDAGSGAGQTAPA